MADRTITLHGSRDALLCACTTRYKQVEELRRAAKLGRQSVGFCKQTLGDLVHRGLVEFGGGGYRLTESGVYEKARLRLATTHPTPRLPAEVVIVEPDYEEALRA